MMQGQGKTFHLEAPRDMLDMLEWQIQCLEGWPPTDSRGTAYAAIACSLTAWHMCDWVYDSLPEPLASHWRVSEKSGLGAFQEWAKTNCPALEVCREFADAFKHRRIDRRPHPDIHSGPMNAMTPDFQPFTKWWTERSPHIEELATTFQAAQLFWLQTLDAAGLSVRSDRGRAALDGDQLPELK